MRRSRRDSGGILLEALLAALLVAAGAALWVAWKRGTFSVGKAGALSQGSKGLERAGGAETLQDSAWLQRQVRELLSRNGLSESHVVRSYNRERIDGPERWVEDTLELRRSDRFESAAFLDGLERVLEKKRLAVLRDLREDGAWTLELGQGGRVFQRIVFLK